MGCWCLAGRGWWKEGRKKERGEARNDIHINIRITGKYVGYPAWVLVFAWEGMVDGGKEQREKE